MIHLREISYRDVPDRLRTEYPFYLPLWQNFPPLSLPTPVTFFVGENGSGKSTLLETIACGVEAITIGSESVKRDPTLAPLRTCARYLRLVWNQRTRKGFFMRAEDFFAFAKRITQMKLEMQQEIEEVEKTYEGRSDLAKGLARMPYARSLHELKESYQDGLESVSHGESFLRLFQSRFVPGGLYLLDEPEAPLSPLRQLAFLALLKEMVAQEAQFIIATHSPILLAFPGATIYSFDQFPLQTATYETLEHVTLTRDFLNNPAAFLHHLHADDE